MAAIADSITEQQHTIGHRAIGHRPRPEAIGHRPIAVPLSLFSPPSFIIENLADDWATVLLITMVTTKKITQL